MSCGLGSASSGHEKVNLTKVIISTTLATVADLSVNAFAAVIDFNPLEEE